MNNLPQQGLLRMETIAHGGGLEHVMKTGFKPSHILHAEHVMVCSMCVLFE